MGQVPELFLPRPETFPERAAQPEGVEHLDRLEPELLGIRPRIEEREQPLVAVGLGHRERENADRGQAPERRELPQASPGGEVHGQRDDHDDGRGAQIGFGHDEANDESGHKDERQGDPPRADLVALAAEPGREIDDERELRELRRLQSEAAPEA